MKKEAMIEVDGESLTLDKAEAVAFGANIRIASGVQKKIAASRDVVSRIAKGDKPVYGINTGFGFFAKKKIEKEQLFTLQENLIKSHAAGYGKPLGIPETRLAMVLRLNVLIKGFTGIRYELVEALHQLINHEIYPIIPEYGSVGASGDLAPLAHLALPLIGLGNVTYKGKVVTAKHALKSAGLTPIKLAEKEGLSLINGTQVMLAVGGIALARAIKLLDRADKIAALSYEGFVGRPDALDPQLHRVRGQKGQIKTAENILKELEGSYLFDSEVKGQALQDPYSLRCAPQIHGPSRDAINYSKSIIERELNAATDNPLVFSQEDKVISGGNFHGQCLALAFDFASIALAEIGNVAERRIECLLNPHMSGLNAFLTCREGIQSGYMVSQYLAASLVNENKLLANPSCTDSIPGNVGVEDHVSMGMTSARKLAKIVTNVQAILAIELLVAAQAVDLRSVKDRLGRGTTKTYRRIRSVVPPLLDDRIISDDINEAVKIMEDI